MNKPQGDAATTVPRIFLEGSSDDAVTINSSLFLLLLLLLLLPPSLSPSPSPEIYINI